MIAGAYIEQVLPTPIAATIQERMTWGKGLARTVLETVDVTDWQIRTLLPIGTPVDRALEAFTRDESVGMSRNASVAWLVKHVQQHIEAGREHAVWFENANASADDPWLRQAISRTWYHGDEVFHCLTPDDLDPRCVEAAINEAQSPWFFFGAMSCAASDMNRSERQLSADDVSHIARHSRTIIIGAYDSEGYLLWTGPARS